MKKIALLLVFATAYSFGQISANEYVLTPAQMGVEYRELAIEGTPYINHIYKKGTTIINGKSKNSALMRYDAVDEAIEILDQNQRPRKLLRRQNIQAVFDGMAYIVVEFQEGKNKKLGYLNPLNEGETVLYYRPKKQLVEAQQPEHGYESYIPPTYKDISTYYIKHGDRPAERVKLGKNQILKKLDAKTSLLKKYISEHNLNLKKEHDVIRLLVHYNSMRETSKSHSSWDETGIGS